MHFLIVKYLLKESEQTLKLLKEKKNLPEVFLKNLSLNCFNWVESLEISAPGQCSFNMELSIE